MNLLARVGAFLGSSQWLAQRRFDEVHDKSPGAAHFNATMFALILAVFVAAIAFKCGPDYISSQFLLRYGSQATAIVESVDLQVKKTRRGPSYETTVKYRFLGRDRQRHEGTSVMTTSSKPSVTKGSSIEVLYDPRQTSNSAWRTALLLKVGDVHAFLFASAFVYPMVGLFFCRYFRWRRNRSPAAGNASRSGEAPILG
jgi:hypothetical protein